ncbi:Dirigent-like protein [Musa troglodytarum]|uniref:Dirigent protein n=1 Tax=Musa troglodytarum TaxID=320322 RepID=A0A9E7JZM2_9LILI|nr:Dirigent-like protein [Musa troglodytarum]
MATYMSNLRLFLFFVFVTIDLSTSARNLDHKTTTSPATDQTITFIMNDVLGSRHSGAPLRSPQPMGVDLGRTPFGDRTGPARGWLPILASAPALEAGTVTAVDEELAGNVELGSPLSGKAQGISVTSMADRSSHIVAMRVTFAGGGGETGDSLCLFGVHQPAQAESHIAVVGGTGRYQDANGIAILKAVAAKSSSERESVQHKNKVLAVHVYLK